MNLIKKQLRKLESLIVKGFLKRYKPTIHKNMKTDTDCNLTGGCEKCRPSFIGCINDEEADKMRKKLQDWRKRFDEDIKRRAKELNKI